MTQQRSNEAIRADLAALLDELFPLDRDDEPNDADLSQGVGWWARTCIWWAKNCRSAWADRDALLARVSELETENGELREQYKTASPYYSMYYDMRTRAERAEAQVRAASASVDEILAERTAYLPDGADHCEVAANDAYESAAEILRLNLAAGLSLQEEQE